MRGIRNLTSETKLKAAENSLNRMNKVTTKSALWMPYFHTFLSSVFGAKEDLLYDYAEKYNLGISKDNRIYANDFENKAKEQNNQSAIKFIEWYKDEGDKLSDVDVVKALKKCLDIEKQLATKPLQSLVGISELTSLSGMDIHDACKKMYELVKDFINDAYRKFP